MIRPSDATLLAYTKLRTHKLRTGLTVGIAGVLFGLILAVLFVVQGIFDSVDRFSGVGLNSRTILAVSQFDSSLYDLSLYTGDKEFIASVEKEYDRTVAIKKAAAKKYSIDYNQALEDPSPISVDSETKQKYINPDAYFSKYVETVRKARAEAAEKFDINEYIAKYPSAKVLPGGTAIGTDDGTFLPMKKGKEQLTAVGQDGQQEFMNQGDEPLLAVLDPSVTAPFILAKEFNPANGEVPVIVPYSQAEKLLGLKPISKGATNDARLERMHEIRDRVKEISVPYCYRNQASKQLLSETLAQEEYIKKSAKSADYIAPTVTYSLPNDTSCGATTITKDTRTAAEKAQAVNRTEYEKTIGEYVGKPFQQKIVLRAVGISSDAAGSGSLSSVGDMVSQLLGSNLGNNVWAVPSDLLNKLPETARPSQIFPTNDATDESNAPQQSFMGYLVEFGNKDEARDLLQRTGAYSATAPGEVSAFPFGSGTLIVDEMKRYFNSFMFWALIIVGGIAAIILSSIIARTVSEGRRESAVFRAIGAKRGDIAGIYGMYTLLLSARVAVFAIVLGAAMALVVEVLFARDATIGARVAYAASSTNAEFHLFGIGSWYIPLVLLVIVVVGCLGAVIPIIRNARRNPINDMRDE